MATENEVTAMITASELTMSERLSLEMNDEDNAARILSSYGADLVFVSGKGWAVWDGMRYSFRSGNLAAREIGHRLRQLVLEEAEWVENNFSAEPEEIEAFIQACQQKRPPIFLRSEADALRMMGRAASFELRKHATKCGNIAKVKTALEACEYQRRAEVEDMDNDPWTLVLPNGDLDLRAISEWEKPYDATPAEVIASKAGWLKPTDRSKLPTKCGGVDFDPAATAPAWEQFLELIIPDPEIRACAQRCLGATIFGENKAQVAIIMRGPGGNGKSTLLNGLSHVLGTRDGYAAPCKIEMFLETGNAQASSATPEEADLPGARAYIATEPGARDILSAKKIKGLTGGDRRMSRGLYADPFFWTPRGMPILSCNRTPKIKDEDEGTRRRLVFLPFDVNLRALPPELQRDQGEVEAEMRSQGSGILNWLIEGYQEFMRRGIDMPEPMTRLKSQLLEAADPVGVFLDGMTEKETSGRLSVSDFYKVHEAWCEQEGRTLYQMKTVGDILVEKGFERGPVQGRSHWKGLSWSANAADLVQEVTGQRPITAAPRPDVDDGPF
ncbi:DNA primase family protein [Roseobacter litoralis]|uniref:DNA primase family protein n=1 Tax=Roseobacter litoralis TaxID=42443 RepID=UPI002494E59E|nr:phage/plasmid primase, P4 family [Roseobacter litoralis]